MERITPAELRRRLAGQAELAVIDVRPAARAGLEHLLAARPVPLDVIELDMPDLVPGRDTPIVLIDDGDGAAGQGAVRLAGLGYRQLAILEGGVPGWIAAGGTVSGGIRSMSKAFGEFLQCCVRTPTITPVALHQLGSSALCVDVRPRGEYLERTVPGALNVSGGALLRLGAAMAEEPARAIVLTCASETRGLVAAQSLIDAGVPNPVFALEGGVMAWHLAGSPTQHGVAPPPFPFADVAPRRLPCPLPRCIAEHTLPGRTTYWFDLRSAAAYRAGHRPGARPVQAVQLVQALDRYVGTWRARIVLIDDPAGVEAEWAGWWLRQMGWEHVSWMANPPGGSVGDWSPAAVPSAALSWTSVPPGYRVLDLATSLEYRAGHIPGARWARRADLPGLLAGGSAVLTSPDGRLAHLAAAEHGVPALSGGTAAWGGALETGGVADEACLDVMLRPLDRQQGVEEAMRRTLAWRVGLLDKAGMPVHFRRLATTPLSEVS